MITCRLACLLIPLASVSCHCASSPTAAPSPGDDNSDSKKGTITVTIDGREATPEETAAFGAFAKDLLSDAVHKAVNKKAKELLKNRLEITDPIESDLLSLLISAKSLGDEELRSAVLVRPGKETKEPRTIALLLDGKLILRFTRVAALVEHPMEVLTHTATRQGHLTQSETFLVHSDGKWREYCPSVHNERWR